MVNYISNSQSLIDIDILIVMTKSSTGFLLILNYPSSVDSVVSIHLIASLKRMYVMHPKHTLFSKAYWPFKLFKNSLPDKRPKKSCKCSLYKNAVGFWINAIRLHFRSVLLDDCSAEMAHLVTQNEDSSRVFNQRIDGTFSYVWGSQKRKSL